LKGGEPDLNTVAKGVIYEWQRGEIPYYNLPPNMTEQDVQKAEEEGESELEEDIAESEGSVNNEL